MLFLMSHSAEAQKPVGEGPASIPTSCEAMTHFATISNRKDMTLDQLFDLLKQSAIFLPNVAEDRIKTPQSRHCKARVALAFAENYLKQGRTTDSLQYANEAQVILQKLTEEQPGNFEWRRDLSLAMEKVGNALADDGKVDDAIASYQAGVTILARLATAAPNNRQWREDLRGAYERIAELYWTNEEFTRANNAYRTAFDSYIRLAANDPGNDVAGLARQNFHLAEALALDEGSRSAKARGLYRVALGVIALSVFPSEERKSAAWRLGAALLNARSGELALLFKEPENALVAFGKSLEVHQERASAEPSGSSLQQALAIAYDSLADAQTAEKNYPGAFENYRLALDIRERLVSTDSKNILWQRGLIVSHGKFGELHMAQGEFQQALLSYLAELSAAEGLALTTPDREEWQQAIFIAHQRISKALFAQRRFDEALSSQRSALGVATRSGLTADNWATMSRWQKILDFFWRAEHSKSDRWQWAAVITHQRIGDIFASKGQPTDALAAYRAGTSIADKLTTARPNDEKRQREIASLYYKSGLVLDAEGQLSDAVQEYSHALEFDPYSPIILSSRCYARARMGDLDAALTDCDSALRERNSPDTLENRGLTYLKMGKFDKALADYNAALEHNPKQADSLYGRGIAKLNSGDLAGASYDFDIAKTLKPDIVEIFARRGVNP